MTSTEKIQKLILHFFHNNDKIIINLPPFETFKKLLFLSDINSIFSYKNQKMTPFHFLIKFYSSSNIQLTTKESLWILQQVDFSQKYQDEDGFSTNNMFLLLNQSNEKQFNIQNPFIFSFLKKKLLYFLYKQQSFSYLLTSLVSKNFSLSNHQLYELTQYLNVNLNEKMNHNDDSIIQYMIDNNDIFKLNYFEIYSLLQKSNKQQITDFTLLSSFFFATVDYKFSFSQQEIQNIIELFPPTIIHKSFQEFVEYIKILDYFNEPKYFQFLSFLIYENYQYFDFENHIIPWLKEKNYQDILVLLEKKHIMNHLSVDLAKNFFQKQLKI
jgi:hypothetical protein